MDTHLQFVLKYLKNKVYPKTAVPKCQIKVSDFDIYSNIEIISEIKVSPFWPISLKKLLFAGRMERLYRQLSIDEYSIPYQKVRLLKQHPYDDGQKRFCMILKFTLISKIDISTKKALEYEVRMPNAPKINGKISGWTTKVFDLNHAVFNS